MKYTSVVISKDIDPTGNIMINRDVTLTNNAHGRGMVNRNIDQQIKYSLCKIKFSSSLSLSLI